MKKQITHTGRNIYYYFYDYNLGKLWFREILQKGIWIRTATLKKWLGEHLAYVCVCDP